MKTLLLLLAVIFVGCVSTKPSDELIYTTGFDFSEYTENGFLITPEAYLGEYQSIGLITVTLWPKVVEEKGRQTASGGYVGGGWLIGDLNVEKAIDQLYTRADEMGADAITKFQIIGTERENGTIIVPGAKISGFAIKRTDIE